MTRIVSDAEIAKALAQSKAMREAYERGEVVEFEEALEPEEFDYKEAQARKAEQEKLEADHAAWWHEQPKPDGNVESADAFMRRLEREQYEKFHKPNGTHTDYGAEQKVKLEPFETVVLGNLADAPLEPREFLDGHNFILMNAVHVMNGDGGAGKTDVVCQLSVACQSSIPFLGLPVRRGPVLFFSAEEPKEEIRRRVYNICDMETVDRASMTSLHVIDFSRKMAWLFAEVERKFVTTPLWERLKLTVGAIKPVVLIIDNRARIFAGNQNDTVLATSAITELDCLGYDNKCAVILLSHPSLSGLSSGRGDSGSVAWANAGRSRSFMAHPDWRDREPGAEDDGKRILTNMKANYTKAGKFVEFVWEGGRFKCTYQPPKIDAGIGVQDKAERVFMSLLRWHLDKHKEVSPNPHATGKYAPKVFAKHSMREGLSITWFEKAMEALLHHDKIVIKARDRGVKFLDITEVK
jgi:RecA-family ATPase